MLGVVDEIPSRRRAPGMTPQRRRETIIAAAIPLLAEHGAALTTARVARAAGIGEATVFRVFADKDELLDACVAEVLRPDTVLDAIAAIPLDQPLADRLVEAAGALEAHLGRIRDVLGGLHGRGGRPLQRRAPAEGAPSRDESTRASVEAVAALFEPDAATLRLPPDQLAGLFLGQLSGRGRPVVGPELTAEQLVDLFLHGALDRAGAAA
jgi:AcrR family transcriptional regulator